ncbi:hypothetical protein SAMIE_1015180 [Sphingobium amiense]|uniref:Uncharacterized protein n=1 Tax=Sphingobium amiense TaxID=135719 RepID=A0A494W635_9SPHN|nr:hypothetical protein [Sphingobium amiense]BBD98017.1 hypothetical protein SAMIE_1015180 [Sphingobium amiense]
MADLAKAFSGLNNETHSVIEDLLNLIWCSGEWTDEHQDMLEAWRKARGEAAMSNWSWWIGDVDDDLYAYDFTSETAALDAGDRRFSAEGRFRIAEARCWNDNVEDGADEVRFAAIRNARVVEVRTDGC